MGAERALRFARSCPTCRESCASSSGSSGTSGSGRSGRRCQALTSPMTSSSLATFGCATSSPSRLTKTRFERRTIVQMLGNRSSRSRSTIATFAPELMSPYSSSGPVHQALSKVATPPASRQPKKAAGHSGRLRIAMATRSPLLHARLLQRLGDGERGAGEALVTRALVAIDDKRALAVAASEQKRFAQGRRRVLPDARAHAANVALLDLERRARDGQRGIGLCQRDGRESLRSRHLSSLRLPGTASPIAQ